jgi:hypothetical protein
MNESQAAARQNDAPAFALGMTQAASSLQLGGLVVFALPILVVLLVVVLIPAIRGAPI